MTTLDYQFLETCLLRAPAFSYRSYNSKLQRDFLKDSFFQNALKMASEVLYDELKKHNFEYDDLDNKAKLAVNKYLNRICYRPTPFGAFSTVSAIDWGNGDPIEISNQIIHDAKAFKEAVAYGNEIRSVNKYNRLYYGNQTVYESDGELRYISSAQNKDCSGFEFSIKSVAKIKIITGLLNWCKTPKTYQEVTEFLSLAGFELILTDELIALGLLMDDLTPNITGRDYSERISDKVNQIKDHYVILEGTANGTVCNGYKTEILKALHGLSRLQPKTKRAALDNFINAFGKKFDGQTLPLLFVLDPEFGVEYLPLTEKFDENDFVKDISVATKSNTSVSWSELHSLLLNKWNKDKPILLTETDLNNLDQNEQILPPSISVMFRVVKGKVLIESAGGSTATALIGRFTPVNKKIAQLAECTTIMEAKANPNVIFAEIAHICDYHTANINRRSHIYPHEIPILTTSTLPNENQILPSDLWVSVELGEISLFSKKHNKRVLPRLSSAFNYSRNNLVLFRFLCDLQHQNIATGFHLDLNALFPNLDYYPRVEYLDSILHLATWYIKSDEFEAVIKAKREEVSVVFEAFKNKLKLPQWVALTVHDNQLVFDLSSTNEVIFFLQTIKNHEHIVLKEFLHPDPIVSGKDGPLVHQFVASLYKLEETYKAVPFKPTKRSNSLRRQMPGGDWLYFNIYCHPVRSGELLAGSVGSLARQLLKGELISEWFFIRYNDPEYHVRLRFKINTGMFEVAASAATKAINKAMKQGLAGSYNMAIYERELERYGNENIPLFEQFFFASSQLVVEFIKSEAPMNEVSLAFISVMEILDGFMLKGEHRIGFLNKVFSSFFKEFNGDNALKYQLDLKYREIGEGLTKDLAQRVKLLHAIKTRKAFKDSLIVLFNGIKKQPATLISKWLADVIHMHLNRVFADNPRKQEMVLYYMLFKHEKKVFAQSKNKLTN